MPAAGASGGDISGQKKRGPGLGFAFAMSEGGGEVSGARVAQGARAVRHGAGPGSAP